MEQVATEGRIDQDANGVEGGLASSKGRIRGTSSKCPALALYLTSEMFDS